MYNKIILVILILALFSLIGCGTSKNDNKNEKSTVPVENKKKVPYEIMLPKKGEGILKTSLIASEVQYKPLETNKKSIVDRGGQIRMNDSLIVISDRKKILLFNKDGRFIRQVGTRGKGPGEYLLIFDFELNKDTIYLTSTGKRSIIKYTLDGKFQEEIEVGHSLTHFRFTSDGHIVSYSNKKGELKFYNTSMELNDVLMPDKLLELPSRWGMWDTFDTYFQTSSRKTLFSNYFCDTIWNVSGGKIEATYILDLRDKLLPRNLVVNYGHDGDFEKFKKQAASFQKINLMETQDKLFLFQKTWVDNDLNAIYIHSFETGVTKKYDAPYIYDDMLSGMELRIKSENQCSEKVLVSFVNPLNLLEELEKTDVKNKPEAFKKWKEQMQMVKYDDNPVVAIVTLK